MTQNVWKLRNVTESLQDVKIGATNPAAPRLNQHFLRANLRNGDVFNAKWLAHLIHHRSFHFDPSALKDRNTQGYVPFGGGSV
jgi:hypothetical protein